MIKWAVNFSICQEVFSNENSGLMQYIIFFIIIIIFFIIIFLFFLLCVCVCVCVHVCVHVCVFSTEKVSVYCMGMFS